jgi:replication factor A1
MSLEFIDEMGTAIQATMWKDAIDMYDAILEVGKVYYVGKGTLRPANKRYANNSNDYEMSLDGRCEIAECAETDVDVSKMSRAFEFVKIDELSRKIGARGSVDVLAVVQSVGELGSVRRKSDGEEIRRRDVVLVDESSKTVTLTLWNALAVEQGERLSGMTDPIVAVRGLRVTDYNGVSLSTVARSEVFIEPATLDVAERVAALRAAYDPNAATVAAGLGLATARGGIHGDGAARRTTLLAMQPETLPPTTAVPETGVVLATTCLIKADQPMYYPACPEEGNNKKVVEENGKWYCESTQKTYDTCRRRYILRVKIQDASGSGWVNMFHEQAVEMLGIEAEALHAARESDPAKYERYVKRAQFNDWSLKIKSKTEEYQGESRRRLTVTHCSKPDYASEAKHLLSLIQAI